jgi:hypothetical protein
MIVALASVSAPRPTSPLWQLSLGDDPKWSVLAPLPMDYMALPRVSLDAAGQRLFVTDGDAIWSLSLSAPDEQWERISDGPAGRSLRDDDAGGSLVYDAARDQLIWHVLAGYPQVEELWALSLGTRIWEPLEQGVEHQRRGPILLDSARDRLIIPGENNVALFDMRSRIRTASDPLWPGSPVVNGSAVIDGARDRLLHFGGAVEGAYPGHSTNAVSALALDTLTWSELVPSSKRSDDLDYPGNPEGLFWDQTRARAIAWAADQFPHDRERHTWTRGLLPTESWTPLPSAGTPPPSGAASTFDSNRKAILSFGGSASSGPTSAVLRLSSSPGAAWTEFSTNAGPRARRSAVAIYDAGGDRMIVHGGYSDELAGPEYLDEVWSLSLGGSPSWTELHPSGTHPDGSMQRVAAYDPIGRRMLVCGRTETDTVLWSLSLNDRPEWQRLVPSGTGPLGFGGPTAVVYDGERHRFVMLGFQPSAGFAVSVFAVELDVAPRWRSFCSQGARPSSSGSTPAVVVPDGLLALVDGAAFRFGLNTPYCDGE